MGSIERMQKYTHTHTHLRSGTDYSHFSWYNRSLVDLIRMNGFGFGELKLLIILFMCVLFLGVRSIRNMLKAIELVCFSAWTTEA